MFFFIFLMIENKSKIQNLNQKIFFINIEKLIKTFFFHRTKLGVDTPVQVVSSISVSGLLRMTFELI